MSIKEIIMETKAIAETVPRNVAYWHGSNPQHRVVRTRQRTAIKTTACIHRGNGCRSCSIEDCPLRVVPQD